MERKIKQKNTNLSKAFDLSSYNSKKSGIFYILFAFSKKSLRIRSLRKDTNESLCKLQKDRVSEDAIKHSEDQVQKLKDQFSSKLDELLVKKEAEIMKV